MVLDDLHWSDDATLELLAALAEPLADLPLLVVGAYRSDGLPRDHLLRRLRHELRRGGRLDELTLAPLEPADDRRAARGRSSATRRRPSLARAIHDRTQGVPFFVEELARALLRHRASLRRARAAWSSARAARCRCPTPSATRC